MQIKKQKLDSELETFDLKKSSSDERVDFTPLTMWVPVKSKEKYNQVQRLSNNKFGKHLKSIVIKAIDAVEVED